MKRYWWITILGTTKEESAAGVRLYVTALIVFFAMTVPLVKLPVQPYLGLCLIFLSLILALLLARPIVAFINPDILKAGDEANAKKMAARKTSTDLERLSTEHVR